MFWGFTPALDIQAKYKAKGLKELNILIVGGSDCRHVLKTVARRYRYEKTQLNFYLMEGCMETVARQLLLLLIAFMPTEELGEVQKTRIFMELYGNSLVRPYVAKVLATTAKELLFMITNYDYLKKVSPFIELDIKYKERDYLENLVKFWCSLDAFDILESWDRKVRILLGSRYDAKFGAFDWDLHMRFHSVGGHQVGTQEYKSFRSTGVSFVWLESEVSKPNRSLVCATLPNGESFIHYGYLGDIQTGPFVAYGLECEDISFLDSTNGQYKFRATDVTERNLRQIFHELEFGNEYEHKTTNDYLMGTLRIQESNQMIDTNSDPSLIRTKTYKSFKPDGIHIKFLSISQLKRLRYRESFKKFFHVMYFGSTYLQYLDNDVLNNIAATNSLLLIENQRYHLGHRDKNLEEYAQSVAVKMSAVNGSQTMDFDPVKHDYMEYIINT